MIIDVHLRVDQRLVDAARRRAHVPADANMPALLRYSLAKLAGWPDPAARQLAHIPARAANTGDVHQA